MHLRGPALSDAEAILEYGSDPEVARYTDWPMRTNVDQIVESLPVRSMLWESGSEFYCVITLPEEDRAIGGVSCRIVQDSAEVGFLLNRRYRGNEFATQAARAIVEWVLSIPSIRRIWATCDTENLASARVLEKPVLSQERDYNIMEPPRIDTERLTIRAMNLCDSGSMYLYRCLPEVYKYQAWVPESVTEISQYLTRTNLTGFNTIDTWFQLGLYLRSSGELIGDIGLHFLPPDNEQTEIGFTLSPEHQGKGYAFEAVTAVIQYLFHRLDKHRVVASVDPDNTASIALLEKLGMRNEGLFRKSVRIRGAWEDDMVYAILRDEWLLKQHNEMDIKRYDEQYLQQIVDVFMDVFNSPPWNDKWTKETANEYISRIINNKYFMGLCCLEGNEVTGFVIGQREYWYTGETFYIRELCISNKKQKCGVGTKLIIELENILRNNGIKSTFLLTERNSTAEKFYMKNGYSKNEKLGAMGKKIMTVEDVCP